MARSRAQGIGRRRRLLVLCGNGWHAPFGASPPFSAHDLVRKPDTTIRDHAFAGGGPLLNGVVVVRKARAKARREIGAPCLHPTHIKEVSLFPNGRHFALNDQPGYGVSCGASGVFIAAVPLLESCRNCGNFQKWRPRSLDNINRDLSGSYGLPVDFGAKMQGLVAIAGALDRGDLLHAHIVTLHLEIPDPPVLAKRGQSAAELLSQRSFTRAACSSAIGTRRSIRVGRPAAPTAPADVSLRVMPMPMLHWKTNQGEGAERRS
jgi:hypothetical protein